MTNYKRPMGIILLVITTLLPICGRAGGSAGGGGGVGHTLFVNTATNTLSALSQEPWGRNFVRDEQLDLDLLKTIAIPDRVAAVPGPLKDKLDNTVDARCRNGKIEIDYAVWKEYAEKNTAVRALVMKEIFRCANYDEGNEAIELANKLENLLVSHNYTAPVCDSQQNARVKGYVDAIELCVGYGGQAWCKDRISQPIGFSANKSYADERGIIHNEYPVIQNVGDWKRILLTYIQPLLSQEPLMTMYLKNELPGYYRIFGVDKFDNSDPVDKAFPCESQR